MIVIALSTCPPKLRGDLSKWLFEISTGVYVGTVSKRVRENLWERVKVMIGDGRAVLVYHAQTEQGLRFETIGTTAHTVDYDGILIMKHPIRNKTIQEDNKKKAGSLEKPIVEQSDNPAKKILPGKNEDYVVVDLETTGLDPKKDTITEIAVLKITKDEISDSFVRYIRDVKIPKNIVKLTGITEELLEKEGVKLHDALHGLTVFIGQRPVVCHNADFDISFLKEALQKENINYQFNEIFDTLKASRLLAKDVKSYRLGALAEYFGISQDGRHEALKDTETTYKLVQKLNEII